MPNKINNQIVLNPFKQLFPNKVTVTKKTKKLQNKNFKKSPATERRKVLSYKAAIEIIKKFQQIKKQELEEYKQQIDSQYKIT